MEKNQHHVSTQNDVSIYVDQHSTTAEVGKVRPIVERTYKLEDAAEALRHLIEDRPFGRGIEGQSRSEGGRSLREPN